jgi:hypothetical protein
MPQWPTSTRSQPTHAEEIEYDAMHREEPTHLSFTLPRGLMRDLRSIVLVRLSAVHHG